MKDFFMGKRIFVTGHTGFKGSWLSLWLAKLGAQVIGYSLCPSTEPNLFDLAAVKRLVDSRIGDVRDAELLRHTMMEATPDMVIHMAAQPLVRESYLNPVETYATNVMGTVNVLEAVRACPSVKAVVNVTTDKCYENREWAWGYREVDPMGGFDPYSSSKGCAELVTAAYRSSYFPPDRYTEHGVAVASARAGNVIGGGDWATDRLIPDCIRAMLDGNPIVIRNPHATRPWQHVLEPLYGYLVLAMNLSRSDGGTYAEGWNFGPHDEDAKPVEWIVKEMCSRWDHKPGYVIDSGDHPHEAYYLKLDCSKARMRLAWSPRWNLSRGIDAILEWNRAYVGGEDIQAVCLGQIEQYELETDRS